MSKIGMDLERPEAVPYFNWDAPVTNAKVRQVLAEGSEDDKVFWIAKIMREARYDDVLALRIAAPRCVAALGEDRAASRALEGQVALSDRGLATPWSRLS